MWSASEVLSGAFRPEYGHFYRKRVGAGLEVATILWLAQEIRSFLDSLTGVDFEHYKQGG